MANVVRCTVRLSPGFSLLSTLAARTAHVCSTSKRILVISSRCGHGLRSAAGLLELAAQYLLLKQFFVLVIVVAGDDEEILIGAAEFIQPL